MTEPNKVAAADKPAILPVDVVGSRSMTEVETQRPMEIEDADVNYQRLLTQFQEKAKFVAGVKKVAVAQTYPTDWLGRKGKDGQYTYDLMGPGAERIKSVTPIGFINMRRREEQWSKQEGPGYTIYFEADVYLGSPKTGPMPVMGSCSSDDDFFSMETSDLPYNPENPEHKEAIESGEGRLSYDQKRIYIRRRIPASEVTREHIEKSALTNLIVNGVTRILGLRRMNAESLKEFGIDSTKVPSFEYGSKTKESGRLAPALEEKRTSIWKMLVEMAGGDEKQASDNLKGWTAFKDFQGHTDISRLTEKQIPYTYDKIKKTYDAWRGEQEAGAKNGGTGKKQGDLFPKP